MEPHKCPVCDGEGEYPRAIGALPEKCNACEGKGVLWPPFPRLFVLGVDAHGLVDRRGPPIYWPPHPPAYNPTWPATTASPPGTVVWRLS